MRLNAQHPERLQIGFTPRAELVAEKAAGGLQRIIVARGKDHDPALQRTKTDAKERIRTLNHRI